jgi:hypothetical protein
MGARHSEGLAIAQSRDVSALLAAVILRLADPVNFT